MQNSLKQAGTRTRAIERKLRGVESLPGSDTQQLLEADEAVSYTHLDVYKRQEQVIPALKKYLDMNKAALGVVKPGGLFATFSCTGLVSEEQFLDMPVSYTHLDVYKRQASPRAHRQGSCPSGR